MAQRVLEREITVPAGVGEVWRAWTTREGVTGFFAPRAHLELRVGGPYEMFFNPDAPPGRQGSEGMQVLAFVPERMLAFEWNAPPEFARIRPKRTRVTVRLTPLGGQTTRVQLEQAGWGEGEDWEQVYDYFHVAWFLVLERLRHRFAEGPLDWSDPYRPPIEGRQG